MFKPTQKEIRNAAFYTEQGNTLSSIGQKQEAILAYNKAIELEPDCAGAHLNKGDALCAIGQKREAVGCYNKAIDINPNCAAAYNSKALALYDTGYQLTAMTCYDKAISVDPNYAAAYHNKGIGLFGISVHENQGAIECFDKALAANPNYVEAYNSKGNVLYAIGKQQAAIECFDMAIAIEPGCVTAYSNKGNALDNLSKIEGDPSLAIKALTTYDQAIKLAPENALFYCNRGKILNNLGREQEALESFDKAYSISQSAGFGADLSQSHINYINQVLSKDRGSLLKKVTELQETTVKTQKVVDSLDQSNLVARKVIEEFKVITRAKTEITNKVIEGFDEKARFTRGVPLTSKDNTGQSSSSSTSHDLDTDLAKQMTEMQTRLMEFMQGMMSQIKQDSSMLINGQEGTLLSQKLMHTEIKIGLHEVKEEQKSQGERVSKLEVLQKTSEALNAKIESDNKISSKDKILMKEKIELITKKMDSLASKDDLDTITVAMKGLMNESKITKGKLADLEDEIDGLTARQDETDERLAKLELLQKTSEDLLGKIQADAKIKEQDKALMLKAIESIHTKMQTLAGREDVETVTASMKELIQDNRLTKGKIADLEDSIDEIIEAQANGGGDTDVTTVHILNEIVYDNALLNHPKLIRDVMGADKANTHLHWEQQNSIHQPFTFNDILDLSPRLDNGLLDRAISDNNAELLLKGLIGLELYDHYHLD